MLALNEKEVTVPVVTVTDTSTPIAVLWARQMIRQLEGSGASGGSRQIARKQDIKSKQILELAKKYCLMSSQSSFVLVETVPDQQKSGKEIELRRIPVALAREWGGVSATIDLCCPAVLYCVMPSQLKAPTDLEFESIPAFQRVPNRADGNRGVMFNSDEALVYEILKTQRPQGGFEVTKKLAKRMLNSDRFGILNKIARTITVKAETDILCLFWTMIALEVLDTRCAYYATIWGSLVEKSRIWLLQELRRVSPELEGKPLEAFVAALLGENG